MSNRTEALHVDELPDNFLETTSMGSGLIVLLLILLHCFQ